MPLSASVIVDAPVSRHLRRTNNNACDTFHVSAAAVLHGCHALYVIRSNSHQPSSILVSTGTRLPVQVTAMRLWHPHRLLEAADTLRAIIWRASDRAELDRGRHVGVCRIVDITSPVAAVEGRTIEAVA